MHPSRVALAVLTAMITAPLLLQAARHEPRTIRVVDTVFVERPIDYDEVARQVALRLGSSSANPTVIEGDLIVKGRLGVGGAPEPGTSYGITVRGAEDAQ